MDRMGGHAHHLLSTEIFPYLAFCVLQYIGLVSKDWLAASRISPGLITATLSTDVLITNENDLCDDLQDYYALLLATAVLWPRTLIACPNLWPHSSIATPHNIHWLPFPDYMLTGLGEQLLVHQTDRPRSIAMVVRPDDPDSPHDVVRWQIATGLVDAYEELYADYTLIEWMAGYSL
jgi:hypothetical protein